jgi:hypothetical protein
LEHDEIAEILVGRDDQLPARKGKAQNFGIRWRWLAGAYGFNFKTERTTRHREPSVCAAIEK